MARELPYVVRHAQLSGRRCSKARVLLLRLKALIVEGDMDRLQFILRSLEPEAEHSEVTDAMVAIAIRSEIESIRQRSTTTFPVIDGYMIQTRAMSA
jgi:hypothetical protein